jgi:hypothetical protein
MQDEVAAVSTHPTFFRCLLFHQRRLYRFVTLSISYSLHSAMITLYYIVGESVAFFIRRTPQISRTLEITSF